MSQHNKYFIGQHVIDEDGGKGVVGIMYDDGDFVFYPGGNDAAHPNPKTVEVYSELDKPLPPKSEPEYIGEDPHFPGRALWTVEDLGFTLHELERRDIYPKCVRGCGEDAAYSSGECESCRQADIEDRKEEVPHA